MAGIITALPLIIAFVLDKILGDPSWLPHPVIMMGKSISFFEKRLNNGENRFMKGAVSSITLIILTYLITYFLLSFIGAISVPFFIVVAAILIFFCLAGKTLIDEVRMVFKACNVSLEEGRRQVARIVGRDTNELSMQEIKLAALETLAENLSDGVIAPLFWYLILGVPGMMAYKMINTLDSMIGYKAERYKEYGCIAARIDDIANYIPARLTAILMIISCGRFDLMKFVFRNGKLHASPNSGYPESALAGILNCRFGGPHNYFGKLFYKPYIGENEREIVSDDVKTAIMINRRSEIIMVLIVIALLMVMQ